MRCDEEDDQRQEPVLAEHDHDQADQCQEVAGDRRDRHVEHVADAADVLADFGGELGRAVLVEIADAERHQMRIKPALIARHDVVADLGKGDRLPVGRKPPEDEGGEDRTADQEHDVGAPVGESLVDDRLHDPGGEAGRRRHHDKACDCESIAADVVAAVFGDDALEDSRDRLGIDCALVSILGVQ